MKNIILFFIFLAFLIPKSEAQSSASRETDWYGRLPASCKNGTRDCIPPDILPWMYGECNQLEFPEEGGLINCMLGNINDHLDISKNRMRECGKYQITQDFPWGSGWANTGSPIDSYYANFPWIISAQYRSSPLDAPMWNWSSDGVAFCDQATRTTARLDLRQVRFLGCPAGYKADATPNPSLYCYKERDPQICLASPVHNPVSPLNRHKLEFETDYRFPNSGLVFSRFYSSGHADQSSFGSRSHWMSNFDKRIVMYRFSSTGQSKDVLWMQNDRTSIRYKNINGVLVGPDANRDQITIADGKYIAYRNNDDSVETYGVDGKLESIKDRGGLITILVYDAPADNPDRKVIKIRDHFGVFIGLSYDAKNRLKQLNLPDGQTIQYRYEEAASLPSNQPGSQLTSVVWQDGSIKQYLYENTNAQYSFDYSLLTGIKDESGQRVSIYTYDNYGGVMSSQRGASTYRFNPWSNTPPATMVNAPDNSQHKYSYDYVGGMMLPTGLSAPCYGCGNTPASISYNSSGDRTKVIDHDGLASFFVYDNNGRVTQKTLASNIYAAQNTAPVGQMDTQTSAIEWHPVYRLPSKITEPGRITEYGYDSKGNLLSEKITDATVTPSKVTTNAWTYTGFNRVATEVNTLGQTTSYTYDGAGNIVSITDVMGRITAYTYDASGRILTMASPAGIISGYTYDLRGRVLSVSQGGFNTVLSYFPTGMLESMTQPSGYRLSYQYDLGYRLIGWSDNRGNSGSIVLDGMGNRTAEKITSGGSTAFEVSRAVNLVNQRSRISTETQGAAQTTKYTYDSYGDIATIGNGLNQKSTYAVDGLRRLNKVTDPLNNAASVTYNQLDAITSAKDFKGVTTNYTRDALGNAKQEVTPDAGTGNATYDVRGLLASTTDATGRSIAVERDALGRITKLNYNNGTSSVLRYDLTGTTYNTAAAPNASIGHLSEVQDPGVTTQYQRDALGRVLRKTQILAGGETRSMAYTYVPAGQGGAGSVQSITYPSGKQLAYQYDSTGLITGMQWNGTALLSGLTWSPLGMPTGWSWPGILALPGATAKLAEARSYNTAGQLTHTGILDLTWDAAGRVSAIEQSQLVPAAASAGGAATTTVQARIASAYTYDAAGHITASGHSLKSTPAVNWPKVGTLATGLLDVAGYTSMGYAYDANGNRLSASIVKTPASGSSATTTRTYSLTAGTNVLASIASTTTPGNAASTKTYQYDAAGAITSATTSGATSGAQYLHYGANARVAKVTGTASSTDPSAVSYLYNSASQRLLKTDARQSTTAPRTEHTLYSEEDSAQLLGTYSNQRSASSAAPAGEMDNTEVIYLPTAQGMVPVAAQINGRLYAIHADHLSTPRRLTNQQGQVAWQWLLTGFGEVSPTTGAKGYVQADSPVANSLPSYAPEVTFNLRYPGQQWDEETQLSYNVNRYYGPQEGRYIQADPIGLDGGWNRFAYVGGNPLDGTDPLGLKKIILFYPADPNYQGAVNAPDDPNMCIVFSHGSHASVNGRNAKELNKILDENGCERLPVKLDACYTGAGPNSIGQQLSHIRNVPVIAPDTNTWTAWFDIPMSTPYPPMSKDPGSIFHQVPNIFSPGNWVTFQPAK